MSEYTESDMSLLKIKRFAAIDSSTIDIAQFVTPETFEQIKTTTATGYRTRHRDMTKGAVGCFLSHISVMRMLVEDPSSDMYIVFEDDAVLPRKVVDDVKKIIATAPDGWDIILLGYHIAKFQDKKNKTKQFDHILYFWGIHAIVINKKGAEKVIREYVSNKMSMQLDSMLSLMIKHGKLSVVAPKKTLISPGDFGSDIQTIVQDIAGVNPYSLEGFLQSKNGK
jgi:GR25 family glycosyltransferase involved in LPS biosynthesis